jgi:hypothetical protein
MLRHSIDEMAFHRSKMYARGYLFSDAEAHGSYELKESDMASISPLPECGE